MSTNVVIAGAGHAAGQTIVSLRQGGFDGRIALIGDEAYLPYQRPPLSKKFLAGELDVDRLLLRHEKFYREHAVDLHLGTQVTAADLGDRTVRLSSGELLKFDRLVLATGSVVRRLGLPGAQLDGVYYLRTIDDVERIRRDFSAGSRLVIVGAGYIGMEVAAVAATCGLRVTVLEVAGSVMARVAAPPVADFYAEVHREAGVDIRCGTVIERFMGGQRVSGVRLANGDEIAADAIIVGIGVLPQVGLAETAGLRCDNGIVVDEYCRTLDEHVLAVGDCTNHPNPLLGQRLRLESVHNAQEQAKTAAATILGRLEPYAQVPWFWSDQYDLKMQIAGLQSPHHETVVRGDPGSRSFAVFSLDSGRLASVCAVNSPKEFMFSKKLIAAHARPDPARLADTGSPFRDYAEELVAAG